MKITTLSFFVFTLCLGCSTLQKKDHAFIAIPQHINNNPDKILSKNEIKYDVNQILFSLNRIYSGRKFLPGNEHKNLVKNVKTIRGSFKAKDFCKKLGSIFRKISDSHLKARWNGNNCAKAEYERKGKVGKNHHHEKKIPWSVRIEKRQNRTALLISITSFHKSSSPVWIGFLEKVKELVTEANLVIIDMRGNGGGDDTIGGELSTLLAGNNLKTPYTEMWSSENPESFQIFVNTFEFWARQRTAKNEKVPHYIVNLKKKFEKKRDRALLGEKSSLFDKSPKSDSYIPEAEFNYEKSIKKPIYILVDSECASSCESTTDFFEFNPLAKTVGETTAGFIHFGNNGDLFLKNSGVNIEMAISYNGYYDNRFLEKKGIIPKVPVPAGKDAMDYAWSNFLEKR